MRPVKRIEIITESHEVKKVVEILERAGVSGYTVMKDVTGKGERGIRGGDELTDVFTNSYVMAACSEEETKTIVERLKPVLRRYGGICLVSDAQWIDH